MKEPAPSAPGAGTHVLSGKAVTDVGATTVALVQRTEVLYERFTAAKAGEKAPATQVSDTEEAPCVVQPHAVEPKVTGLAWKGLPAQFGLV